MTNLEAIQAKVNYPLSENTFILALEDRGVVSDAVYATGEAFELAYADVIITLTTSPNITEGGYSISLSEKTALLSIADKIYTKYSVANPLGSLKPKATFVQRF